MKIKLKQDLNYFEFDSDNQTYSFETDCKEMFDMLFYGDSDEAYFESQPNKLKYLGYGNYGDHGEEFTEVVIKNLGVWFLYYPETVRNFVDQVNHTIYSEAEEYYQIF